MIRIKHEQIELLTHSLSLEPIDRVEAYLRKNYPDDCSQYDREALRAWIAETLPAVEARGERSTNEILFDMGTRWVLRAFFGEPPTSTPDD